ncbi:30S ribosome-binding factor RbfA [Aliiroseovarius lamellibrachiae]|uniref:30S ribosome-binding factor RbfA n=1 Tax=Aliiroseovarius lamellibrachiae TaxID=1924933 RepID=UPI001BDF99B8|nr:30S ribosome-binding factor RbfA [Aliiroseovarius lamellibrachiae]MBT2131554.1 30S ribosome-binding factor RbfA [Aliiroseovarius lamellibrachiae]
MAKNRFSENKGPSQRQLRVAELIRRTLSEVLMRGEIHDPDLARMSITVGEVRVTPDLRIATVFVLPLGGEGKDEVVALLARNKYEIRRALNKAAQLKHSPDLRFMLDDTFDQMDATRKLFEKDEVRRDLEKDDESDPE